MLDQGTCGGRVHGLRIQETLRVFPSHIPKRLGLLWSLDTFGDSGHVERTHELVDRLRHAHSAGGLGEFRCERNIEFHVVEWVPAQIGEGRVSRAEIVKGELYAERLQAQELRQRW